MNRSLAHLSNVPPSQLPAARSKVVEELVTRQLAINKAQELKLDRSPTVVAALEDARSDILMRAYFEQISAAVPKPSDDEVKQYYQAHPELFAARRLYSMKEVSVAATPEVLAYARDFSNSGKPIEQFVQWLQDKGVRLTANSVTRAPETLPLDFVPKLASAKDGSIVTMSTESGLYVAQLVSSRAAPVSEADAGPSIRRYLNNQRSKEAIEHELANLRAHTKIEYSAEFAQAAVPAPAAGDATKVALPSALPKPAAADPPTADVVKKGIGGMK